MSRRSVIRIATRASALAMWQAHQTSDWLIAAGVESVEIVPVSTVGDRDQTEPLSALSTSVDGAGTGVFTREVQRAVLDGRADVAVHSLKDLPTELTPGLALAGIPKRATRSDRLVFPQSFRGVRSLEALSESARVGTGALRRQAQLLAARPDLRLAEIRGNIDTRLKKLDSGEYDAIVLASAGLERLGFEEWPTLELVPPTMWPAVGQAALGIECRVDDTRTRDVLASISHPATRCEVLAERAMLKALRAGCHAPVGAMASSDGERTRLEGVVLSSNGGERVIAAASGVDPTALGEKVATMLIAAGAGDYLTNAAER